jgi:hypothetical protein
MKLTRVGVLSFLGSLGGLIVFSQGSSFAWWSKWQPISHYINLHAGLLALAGLSLACCFAVIHLLKARIEKLEAVVAASSAKPPTER